MAPFLTPEEIKTLGFDWPKYTLVAEHSVLVGGRVDVGSTLEKLRASQRVTQKLIDDAYIFKQRTGADYSDFSDRFDDHVHDHHGLGRAISYLEEVIRQATATEASSGGGGKPRAEDPNQQRSLT